MPDLTFEITRAEPLYDASAPAIALQLQLTNPIRAQRIHAALLRCQVQIEAPRRRYTPFEQEQLRDLFGPPERWAQTLRAFPWTTVSVTCPGFTDRAVFPIPVPCEADFNLATTKYFHALEGGEVSLLVLFSGTMFYNAGLDEAGAGGLQVAPVSWNKEARFRLPVQIWKDVMAAHYANTAWFSLRRDVFDRLYRFKIREGIPTFEETLEHILEIAEQRREALL